MIDTDVDLRIWRPVLAQIATLSEIQERWSLDDLLDAHEALDVKAEAEARERERVERERQ